MVKIIYQHPKRRQQTVMYSDEYIAFSMFEAFKAKGYNPQIIACSSNKRT